MTPKNLPQCFLLLSVLVSVRCGGGDPGEGGHPNGSDGSVDDGSTNDGEDGSTSPSTDGGGGAPWTPPHKTLFFSQKNDTSGSEVVMYRFDTGAVETLWHDKAEIKIETSSGGKFFFLTSRPNKSDQVWVFDSGKPKSANNPKVLWTPAKSSTGEPGVLWGLTAIGGKLYSVTDDPFATWMVDPATATAKKLFSDQGFDPVGAAGKIVFRTSSNFSSLISWDPSQPESNHNPLYVPGNRGWGPAALGNKVYHIDDGPTNLLYAYDASSGLSASNPRPLFHYPARATFRPYIHAGKIYYVGSKQLYSPDDNLCIFDPARPESATNPKEVKVGDNLREESLFGSAGKFFLLISGATAAGGGNLALYDPSLAASSTNPKIVDMPQGAAPASSEGFAFDGDQVYFFMVGSAGEMHVALLDTTKPIQVDVNPKKMFALKQDYGASELHLGTR